MENKHKTATRAASFRNGLISLAAGICFGVFVHFLIKVMTHLLVAGRTGGTSDFSPVVVCLTASLLIAGSLKLVFKCFIRGVVEEKLEETAEGLVNNDAQEALGREEPQESMMIYLFFAGASLSLLGLTVSTVASAAYLPSLDDWLLVLVCVPFGLIIFPKGLGRQHRGGPSSFSMEAKVPLLAV